MMNDREGWRERVRDIRASITTWWWWYIYIVIHRQIYFVLSELISVSRQARFPKLGSKPGWLKRQSKILPQTKQSVCRWLYIYIYIHIYTHLQTDCFVISHLFTVARYAGRFKLGSKPAQHYVRLSVIPLSPQSAYVSLGIIRHYVVAFAVYILPYLIPKYSIQSKSFALRKWQPLILSPECSTPGIYICMNYSRPKVWHHPELFL